MNQDTSLVMKEGQTGFALNKFIITHFFIPQRNSCHPLGKVPYSPQGFRLMRSSASGIRSVPDQIIYYLRFDCTPDRSCNNYSWYQSRYIITPSSMGTSTGGLPIMFCVTCVLLFFNAYWNTGRSDHKASQTMIL